MQDQNFDQLSQQFQKQIYDTIKGQIRLALLQEDFQQAGPDLSQPGLKVLDAGGGIGQFSATLAARGHQVTLCDLSEEMLKLAHEEFARTAPGAEVQFIHGPLQVLSEERLGQFDLLLFHAVMEWLVDPFEALQRLLPLVRPGGFFSVMFYNKHALRWRYLSSAQFSEGMGDTFRRREGSLTPPGPLEPQQVHDWLQAMGLEVRTWTGIRGIYDHIPRQLRAKVTLEQVLPAEHQFARVPPYRDLGRYVHMLCYRPL
ncbi:hypothetical protein C4K68_08130 [Pokkaliibacter plantistimulans]|uniref:Methyltransferase type 11 domain-containing protein n=1 Tax=Proteobacteria bacterium 228 TaxID=2083153 RepID=A0A2S5KUD1_9PROT|nr:methyltransferase domain-containing protein [Pokkaliibacter plantistimulans]PPC77866.1 hypothetical protein C4K68_08130 [Pokkaliibacter plantistimulans]